MHITLDTLKKKDGTFKSASVEIIEAALDCGHTAHLETGLGIVAFRPYDLKEEFLPERAMRWPGEKAGKNWLLEFYPSGGDVANPVAVRGPDKAAMIEFAYKSLNGSAHDFEAGDCTTWYANQGEREAEVLAVTEDEVLIEYEMPGTCSGRTTSALVICKAKLGELVSGRSVSHKRLPKKWVAAMIEQGTDYWIGMGQGSHEIAPFPTL